MGLLRTASAFRHLVGSGGQQSEGVELWVRQARKENQPVVAMHCVKSDGDYVLTCEIYPADRFTVEPLEHGPYVFQTEREAEEFADEASLIFEYLGCDIRPTLDSGGH